MSYARAGESKPTQCAISAGETHTLTPSVTRGDYVARAGIPGSWQGPPIRFSVGDGVTVVEILSDAPVWRQVEVCSYLDYQRIQTVEHFAARPAIEGAAWAGEALEHRRTPVLGQYEVCGWPGSRCRIEVTAEGFVDGVLEARIPDDATDFIAVELCEVSTLEVKVVGGAALNAGIKVQQWGAGLESAVIGDDGTANVKVQLSADEVCLHLDYPGNRAGYVYVPIDYVDEGRVFPLEIGQQRAIELVAHASEAVESSFEGRYRHVTATWTSRAGAKHSMLVEFVPGVPLLLPCGRAERVVLGIQSTDGVADIRVCATRTVLLEEDGVTSVTLFAEKPPLELQVVDGKGEAVAGLAWYVRSDPDVAGWVTSGVTCAEGYARVPAQVDSRLLFTTHSEFGEPMFVDVPLDPRGISGANPWKLPTTPAYDASFPVVHHGRLVADVVTELVASVSGVALQEYWTGADDFFEAKIVEGSRAHVTVAAEGYWFERETYPVRPGRNEITAWALAELHFRDPERVRALRHDALGVTLGALLDAERLESAKMEGGGRTLRVPEGTYSWEDLSSGEAETHRITVGPELAGTLPF